MRGNRAVDVTITQLLSRVTQRELPAKERLLKPPPGGRIEAARAPGVDLTLLVERLRKTPEERVRDLQRAAAALETVRGKVRVRPGVVGGRG
jgi:hypothetical protein